MRMSCYAAVMTSLLALCLLVPVVGMHHQDDAALEKFHNRVLTKWPASEQALTDPSAYFHVAKGWLSDRVFPIQRLTALQAHLALSLFDQPPEPRITLGKDGHVFVNGASNTSLYGMIESTCLQAHTQASVDQLEIALVRWAQLAHARALGLDVVVVPTPASLYADKLPSSVPVRLREACEQRTAGQSPLLRVRAPYGSHFVYPLMEMLAARNQSGFFPKANWHPDGLSLKLLRDTYLARRDVGPCRDETVSLGVSQSELLGTYGIERDQPMYRLHNPHVVANEQLNAALRAAVPDLFIGDRYVTRAFQNSRPGVDESVLMLADSYGDLASIAFAGAFRQLLFVNTNMLRGPAAPALLERLQRVTRIDRVLLLVQEGNTPRIAALLPR